MDSISSFQLFRRDQGKSKNGGKVKKKQGVTAVFDWIARIEYRQVVDKIRSLREYLMVMR